MLVLVLPPLRRLHRLLLLLPLLQPKFQHSLAACP
jgi:hypothetical protein